MCTVSEPTRVSMAHHAGLATFSRDNSSTLGEVLAVIKWAPYPSLFLFFFSPPIPTYHAFKIRPWWKCLHLDAVEDAPAADTAGRVTCNDMNAVGQESVRYDAWRACGKQKGKARSEYSYNCFSPRCAPWMTLCGALESGTTVSAGSLPVLPLRGLREPVPEASSSSVPAAAAAPAPVGGTAVAAPIPALPFIPGAAVPLRSETASLPAALSGSGYKKWAQGRNIDVGLLQQ